MNRSKLIPILKSFSKDEINEFDKFLNSPFSGSKKFVLNFYRILIKHYPEFNEDDIDKKKLFGKLYFDKKYNDGLVRRIISDLIRYSEEFLKFKNFRNNKLFQNQCLLNELRNRNLDAQFRIRSENILKKINSLNYVDPDLLLEIYFTNLEVKEFRTFIRDAGMHEANAFNAEAMTVFFLRLLFFYINHIRTFSKEINVSNELVTEFFSNFNLNEFLKYIEKSNGKYSNYLKLILYSYNIVNDKNDRNSYFKLNQLLIQYPAGFSKKELKNVYINIIKFFNYQNDHYNNYFLEETYILYEKLLNEYYAQEPGLILQMSFCRNYINICRQTGRYLKIKDFQKKYNGFFPEVFKNDLVQLCDSLFYFGENDFAKSLSAVSKVNIDRDIFKKDVKILKMKNLYELGYLDSAFSELDNIRHFLSSTQHLNALSLKKGKNFARYYSALLKLMDAKNRKDELMHLTAKLEKDKFVNEKLWLLQKFKNLI